MQKAEVNQMMLDALRRKGDWVRKTESETGLNLRAASAEVERQIAQVLSGEKITKSDGTYGED